MIINQVDINPYEILFRDKYINAKTSLFKRRGWIVALHSDGKIGYGDASPLDGFSAENFNQVEYGLEGFKLSIDSMMDFDFNELIALSEAHGEQQLSIEFAIQSALYDLVAKLNNLPLHKYLNNDSSNSVPVNYYKDSLVDPFNGMIVKIKITDRDFNKQIEMLDYVEERFKGKAKMRLDFNGSYDLRSAIKFCRLIKDRPIEYIEQPLPYDAYKDMYQLSLETDIPIAVDETICDIDSIYKVLDYKAADIFVLKPMVLGGFSRLSKIIKLIRSSSKRFNISSLLESNIGRLYYLHISAALEVSEPCGIATDIFFKSDLCDFPLSKNGHIEINDFNGIGVDEINI